MTDTLQNSRGSPTMRRRWVLPVVAVVVLTAGVGAGLAIAAGRNDSPPASADTPAQIADITQACTNWRMSTPTAATNASSWCADMTAWMNQEFPNSQMMGAMWRDPDRMLATCRSWMATIPNSGASVTWCDDMVNWMRQHMNGDWNDWMMNGSMMGR